MAPGHLMIGLAMVGRRCGLAGVSFDSDSEPHILAPEWGFCLLTLPILYVQRIVDIDE